MPTPSKTAVDSRALDVPMLLGQLIAATEAAAAGTKSLRDEAKDSARLSNDMGTAVQLLDHSVRDLLRLVRDGNGESLVAQMQEARLAVSDLREDLRRAEAQLDKLRQEMTEVQSGRHQASGGYYVLAAALGVVGWLITTGVALYAAVR